MTSEISLRPDPPDTRLTLASIRWRTLRQNSNFENERVFEELLDAIADNGEVDLIQSLIRRLGQRLQYLVDLQGLDAFQHAIIHHNVIAMRLFFNKHLFQQPHQPKCNPYLHLASRTGCLPAISLLLHERPSEFYQKEQLEIPYYLLHRNDPADFSLCRVKKFGDAREKEAEIAMTNAKGDSNARSSRPSSSSKDSTKPALAEEKQVLDDSGFSEMKKEELGEEAGIEKVRGTSQSKNEKSETVDEVVDDNQVNQDGIVESHLETKEEASNDADNDDEDVDCIDDIDSDENIEANDVDSDEPRQCLDPETEERLNNEFMHRMCMEDPDILEMTEPLTPLEHAARGGHLEAVETLLSEYPAQRQATLLESAVILNCPDALHLLFCRKDPVVAKIGIDAALKEAIRRKLSVMIEALVAHGADHDQAFNGLNCLHCMYTYTSGYQIHYRRMEGVLESTKALLDVARVPVNVASPLGSHPLYSLMENLAQDRDQFEGMEDEKAGATHLAAMKVLLEAGADPNLDEEHLHNLAGDDANVTFGRQLFGSALKGFFSGLSVFEDKNGVVPDATRLLLRHGAVVEPPDAATFRRPLVNFVHYAYKMEMLSPLHRNSAATTLLLLLRHGADVEAFDFDWGFPINHYFNFLAQVPDFVGPMPTTRVHAAEVKVPFILLDHMAPGPRSIALRRIRNAFLGRRPVFDDESDAAVDDIVDEVKAAATTPVSLQHLARLRIWKSVGRKVDRLEGLPLPVHLVDCMFEPEYYGIEAKGPSTTPSVEDIETDADAELNIEET